MQGTQSPLEAKDLYERRYSSGAQLLAEVDRYLGLRCSGKLTMAVLAPAVSARALLESRLSPDRERTGLHRGAQTEAVGCYRLVVPYTNRGRAAQTDGQFWLVHDDPEVVSVLTLDDAEFWDRALARLLHAVGRHLVRFHLTTPFLLERAEALEVDPRTHETSVARTTYRQRVGAQDDLRYRTHQVWESVVIPPRRFRRETAGEDLTVKVLQLSFTALVADGSEQSWRRCGVTAYRDSSFRMKGSLSIPHDVLVRPAMDYVRGRYRFFSERAREVNTGGKLSPIEIRYEYPIFHSERNRQALLGVLRRMSHVSFSVIAQDERFVSTLVDYTDGSAYEIVCCAETALLILPQYRATRRSLDRLCEQILLNFREGQVADYEKTP